MRPATSPPFSSYGVGHGVLGFGGKRRRIEAPYPPRRAPFEQRSVGSRRSTEYPAVEREECLRWAARSEKRAARFPAMATLAAILLWR